MPNEISVVFHNGSNYDYHSIIKELANEFERQFECLVENKEKYKTFSVPTKMEITKINKDGNKSVDSISYRITFIDSTRFMTTSLSNLVNKFAEGIHKIKCKDCDCFLNMKVSRLIWYNINSYLAIKFIQTKLMKNLRTRYNF